MVRVPSPSGSMATYNPTTVAQFAMAYYNMFVKTNKDSFREAMRRHMEWLIDNFVELGGFGVWQYRFDYLSPGYVCRSPWVSCMAQGQALSAIIRANEIFPEVKGERVARLASRAFGVSTRDGGVRRLDRHGCVWYKEFVCEKSPTTLNGMIFALIGLNEYSEYFGDEDAMLRFREGVDTLKRHLSMFEIGVYPLFKWSRYDDGLIVFASEKYHGIHIRQLEELYRITGDEYFMRYSLRWKRFEQVYLNSPPYRAIRALARGAARLS